MFRTNSQNPAFRFSALLCTFVALAAAPALADKEYTEDVIYGHKDGMALVYHVVKPSDQNGAAVLLMISGGWNSWRLNEQILTDWTSFLSDAGFTVFGVNHGSAPRYKVPDAVSDVRRAVRHIRANAENWGIDGDRMGVYGASAGGHLSLMLGLDSDDGNTESPDPVDQVSNRLQAVVAYFPPTDLKDIVSMDSDFPALRFDAQLAAANSPIEFVSEDDPPVLLIHGDLDELVPIAHSERLNAALLEVNASVEFITIEGAAHSFGQPDHQRRVSEATLDWFTKNLGVETSED